MGSDPSREPPFFFTKPADAVVPAPHREPPVTLPFPCATANLHFEVEQVVALSAGGADISVADAPRCVFGYGVGVDFTRRDMQARGCSVAGCERHCLSLACSHTTPLAGRGEAHAPAVGHVKGVSSRLQ